ncbi:MAG: NADP-dependent oxidoreductase, partial [Actinobacteria bacterium]|nr:NADP-dependent oxidoreductase [Actinomycetota bacterium]
MTYLENSGVSSNTSIHLARRPSGLPVAADWRRETHDIPEPGPGEFLVRITMISLDPAMRGWLDDRPSYLPPVAIDEVMRAGAVGEVVISSHPRFKVGDYVLGTFGVQEYAISGGTGVTLIDPKLGTPSMYLGVLGMTGMT